MHYWNRANFEGLADLARALRADPRLEQLASYCELRERGLRREAFGALERFLEGATALSAEEQREVVLVVLAAHARTPDAHQFLSQPLTKRFVEPVLERWSQDCPEDPVPLAELALLLRDQALLERALELEPRDARVRACLASLLLGRVEFATHHLVEGLFIGDPAESAELLDRVEVLTGGASAEVAELRRLLADWTEYRAAPAGTFPEWCRARGREHRWWSVYYYG